MKAITTVLVLGALAFSCTPETPQVIEEPLPVLIEQATDAQQSNLGRWVKNAAARDEAGTYDFDNVYSITDVNSGNEVLTVLDESGDNSLIFFPNNAGELGQVITATASMNDNGGVQVTLSDLSGQVYISYVDSPDGSRKIIERAATAGRQECESWYCKFSGCIDMVHNPFGDGFGDLVFDVVANAATLGLYSGSSLLVCGLYGAFKD